MSTYEATVVMLGLLPEDDLKVVNYIVRKFVSEKNEESDPFFKQLTKAEFMEKLAIGRKQNDEGRCVDSETMEKELAEEFEFC